MATRPLSAGQGESAANDGPHGQQPPRSVILALSLVFGLCISYLVFATFLQKAVIQVRTLAAAGVVWLLIAAANYVACNRWILPRLETIPNLRNGLALCLVLPAVFLPLLYRTPSYPASPLLRPWTELAIQFNIASANTAPAEFARKAVSLEMADETVNIHDFQPVGDWQILGNNMALLPGTAASLDWMGAVSQTATLTIMPPATLGDMVISWDGSSTAI